MLYRIQLNLAFDNKSDMDIIVQAVKKVKSKAVKINTGQANEEVSKASWHECWHDDPSNPLAQSCDKTLQEL